MNASRSAVFLFFVVVAFSSGLSSCSSGDASDAVPTPARTATPVALPERRPDATVIIESVKANELVVIEMPQRPHSGSGARSGSWAVAGGQAGQSSGRAGGSASRLFGGGGMRFGGPGGGAGGQSSAELEELLKSGKRLRIRVPVGIPVAVTSAGSGVASAEGSFSDIRVGYRASFWLLPADAGPLRTAEAVTILGKVQR